MIYKGDIFNNKNFDCKKLVQYGFIRKNDEYIFETYIANNDFKLILTISNNKIYTKIIEVASDEEYSLIYVENIEGEFVGNLKNEYEKILLDISEKCTVYNVFKSDYAKKIIEYVRKKYLTQAEHLWEKTPNNAVFREKNTSKWYAALLTVEKKKIGIKGSGTTEILDLKAKPETIAALIDNKKYFSAYHMNKKHWFTVCLDGSVDINKIYELIDSAYDIIALKK